jgi:hypothetical protein
MRSIINIIIVFFSISTLSAKTLICKFDATISFQEENLYDGLNTSDAISGVKRSIPGHYSIFEFLEVEIDPSITFEEQLKRDFLELVCHRSPFLCDEKAIILAPKESTVFIDNGKLYDTYRPSQLDNGTSLSEGNYQFAQLEFFNRIAPFLILPGEQIDFNRDENLAHKFLKSKKERNEAIIRSNLSRLVHYTPTSADCFKEY